MNHEKEYWIFADESVQDGEFFSKFFGGCIVPASRHAEIEARLARRKKMNWVSARNSNGKGLRINGWPITFR